MNIPLTGGRHIAVGEGCKDLIVHGFSAMLFTKNGYVYPESNQVLDEIYQRIEKLEKTGITVDGDTLYNDLKTYTRFEMDRMNKLL
jgi:hypothetical protein